MKYAACHIRSNSFQIRNTIGAHKGNATSTCIEDKDGNIIMDNCVTNDIGLSLLKFASSNDVILANTFGIHKPSRKWKWHSPNREHHNQIYYIMIRKLFRSNLIFPQTRTFRAVDIGSDHDLVMMTFRLRLKRDQQQTSKRIK